MPKRLLARSFYFDWLPTVLVVAICVCSASISGAQDTPIISGGVGFFHATNQGLTFFQPVIAPVAVVPLGSRFLVESRADLREFIQLQDGTASPYQRSFTPTLEYLQLDYLANRRLTFTAGRFLTPFGTYNERLTPIWVRNLQDAPLIFAIGTRTSGSSDGAMLRGSLVSNAAAHVDYTAYFSASVATQQLQAGRAAGGRVNLFFPKTRVELGASYARFLQGTSNNSVGAHFWWEPWSVPLQVRSEYAHGAHAQGYWIEAAYRLSQWRGSESLTGRVQPVIRMQQVFRNSPGQGDGLPSADTQQVDFGLDYFLPHDVRIDTSYSRTLSSVGNGNIWETGVVYRFLFPVWKGK